MKTKIIEEFKKRFGLTSEDWNSFLQEYQEKDKPLRVLCEDYKVDYNAFRYLAYQLNFDNATKVSRTESVLNLNKQISIEQGKDYDIEFELEKEVKSLVKKNRQLTRSINNVRDENSMLRKMIKEEDKEYNLNNQLIESLERWIDRFETPKIEVNYIKPKPYSEWGDIFITSDQHANIKLLEEEVGNEYNFKVWEDRYDKVVDTYLLKESCSKNLYFLDNGDNWDTGLINPAIASECELAITDAFDRFIAQNIKSLVKLSKKYNKIKYCITPSNHLRFTEYKPNKQRWDTLDTLYAVALKYALKAYGLEDKVEVIWSRKGYLMHNINGMNIAQLHGQEIKSFSDKSVNSLQAVLKSLYGVTADLIIRSHTHLEEFKTINKTLCLTTGTLKGGDNYSVANAFGDVRIAQHQLEISEEGYLKSIHRVEIKKDFNKDLKVS